VDKHGRGSYDVGNRVFLWIVPSEPDCDWDVVGRLTVGNGEGAVKTEKQLGPSVVVSCGEEGEVGECVCVEKERDELNCRHRSLDELGGIWRGAHRRRRRQCVSLSRNECFHATRSGWMREASSDERIRNLQGGCYCLGLRERADLQSPSCPPDRQYNISSLLAHFVLSGSFTVCAVLGPPLTII